MQRTYDEVAAILNDMYSDEGRYEANQMYQLLPQEVFDFGGRTRQHDGFLDRVAAALAANHALVMVNFHNVIGIVGIRDVEGARRMPASVKQKFLPKPVPHRRP